MAQPVCLTSFHLSNDAECLFKKVRVLFLGLCSGFGSWRIVVCSHMGVQRAFWSFAEQSSSFWSESWSSQLCLGDVLKVWNFSFPLPWLQKYWLRLVLMTPGWEVLTPQLSHPEWVTHSQINGFIEFICSKINLWEGPKHTHIPQQAYLGCSIYLFGVQATFFSWRSSFCIVLSLWTTTEVHFLRYESYLLIVIQRALSQASCQETPDVMGSSLRRKEGGQGVFLLESSDVLLFLSRSVITNLYLTSGNKTVQLLHCFGYILQMESQSVSCFFPYLLPELIRSWCNAVIKCNQTVITDFMYDSF